MHTAKSPPSIDEIRRIVAQYAPARLLPGWFSYGIGFTRLQDGEDSTQFEPVIVDGEFIGYDNAPAPKGAA